MCMRVCVCSIRNCFKLNTMNFPRNATQRNGSALASQRVAHKHPQPTFKWYSSTNDGRRCWRRHRRRTVCAVHLLVYLCGRQLTYTHKYKPTKNFGANDECVFQSSRWEITANDIFAQSSRVRTQRVFFVRLATNNARFFAHFSRRYTKPTE